MAGNGGRRPGAGRKKGGHNKQTTTIKHVLRDAIDRVAEVHGGYDALVGKLWELAEGVEVQKKDRQGHEQIYSQPPDGMAAKTLLEFRFGKAPQTTTLQGDAKQPLKIIVEYVNGKPPADE